MPGPAVEVENLSKRYGEIQALGGVSFSIPEGEIFGYLGPNGAGKTTTIRILTGITLPTGGTARIFGHDIMKETIESRRHMGIVHETSNVYDDLTAWPAGTSGRGSSWRPSTSLAGRTTSPGASPRG
jgi:ABC-2 type transport system ATP-binding protein